MVILKDNLVNVMADVRELVKIRAAEAYNNNANACNVAIYNAVIEAEDRNPDTLATKIVKDLAEGKIKEKFL